MTDRWGFAVERTTLSWNRTALGAAAFGALLLKLALGQKRLVEVIAAAAALALAASLARPPASRSRRRRIVVVAVLSVATAALTAVSLAG
ncbi:MAG: DUF202 domain-containing protein [Actinomycetota bacterium]